MVRLCAFVSGVVEECVWGGVLMVWWAGYNHSGKLGSINFLNGMMGIANAERALEYIRVITEFITQVCVYDGPSGLRD